MKIGICAPSAAFTREDAARVLALAAAETPEIALHFHEQCFAEAGHFAGSDHVRRQAFVTLANDPALDAVWFARGGYGACRMAGDAMPLLGAAARDKVYMGYSDGGNLLGALYRHGIGHPVHGPMPADIRRDSGADAVRRGLHWFAGAKSAQHCPSILPDHPHAAFNLMTLSMMTGTDLMPDLAGHVLLLEEVSEYLYGFDRAFFHVASNLAKAGLAGIRLGRVSDVPENDRPFGFTPDEIARHWCARFDIPWLGTADIGHDAANRIVPFGLVSRWLAP